MAYRRHHITCTFQIRINVQQYALNNSENNQALKKITGK